MGKLCFLAAARDMVAEVIGCSCLYYLCVYFYRCGVSFFVGGIIVELHVHGLPGGGVLNILKTHFRNP